MCRFPKGGKKIGPLPEVAWGGYKAKFSDPTYVVLNNASNVSGNFAVINTTVSGGVASFGASNSGTTAGINLTAGTTSYTGTLAQNWSTAANWDRGTPNANADAAYSLAGSNTLTVDTAASAKTLTVTSSGGTNTVSMTGGMESVIDTVPFAVPPKPSLIV